MTHSSVRRTASALALLLAQLLQSGCGGGGGSTTGGPAAGGPSPQTTTHAISGAVTGAVTSGVTVTLSGARSATASTGANGAYALAGLPDGTYMLTPSKAGFTFTPATLAVTLSGSDATGRDFTASAIPPATYAISGAVSGAVKSGVTVVLGGASSATIVTGPDGAFSFAGLSPGVYSVTPSLAGYTFSPPSAASVVVDADITGVAFVSTAVPVGALAIRGAVSGAVTADVTLTLSGANTGATRSAADGTYEFSGLVSGTYAVTPAMPGFTFSPSSRVMSIDGANVSGQDFVAAAVATPVTFRIGGSISGATREGVTITLAGTRSATYVTGAAGTFGFAGLPNGSYTITPSKGGFTFSPAGSSVVVDGADVMGLDYTATASLPGTYTVSGTVSGAVTSGVQVALAGPRSETIRTGAGGGYSFTGLPSGTYTVTPSLTGYAFSPASRTVTLGGDATGMGFTSTCGNGESCTPANPCHLGIFTCSGVPVCTDLGSWVPNGTSCGPGQVCGQGNCNACTEGQACTPANPCHAGAIACGSGTPRCNDSGTSVPDGTACGTNQVCAAGTCLAPCIAGQACTPANPCHVGAVTCPGGAASCSDTGALASDGTPCDDVGVCTAGTCGRAVEGFGATGRMTVGRSSHTATLLPNGKVLVAGGASATAELYDPATRAFTRTGSMTTPRTLHAATLLRNGKVLITGGFGAGAGGLPDSLASAELYDPTTGNFTATGSMSDARYWHTATLLPSGRVLVASGRRSIAGVQSSVTGADLYDPDTGSFTATDPMLPAGGEGTTRAGHSATLLPSGKVLLAGGAETFSSGPPPGFGFYTRAHLYDPATGTFGPTGQTTTYRQFHTATLLPNGKVLLAGGGSARAELYDPATGVFTPTGLMAFARGDHTATLVPSGRVLIAGGDSLGALPSAEVYDPAPGEFTPTGAMSERRQSHAATLLPDGAVLLTGGTTSLGGPDVCGNNRGADLWMEGEARVVLSSPATYTCHQGFSATLGIANGSAVPLEVHGIQLDLSPPGACPGTAPDATWNYPPLVTTVAPGQTATALVLASAPYCCPAPGCTADSFYGAVYAFRVSTSAGVLRATVSPVIDLRGCNEVCP